MIEVAVCKSLFPEYSLHLLGGHGIYLVKCIIRFGDIVLRGLFNEGIHVLLADIYGNIYVIVIKNDKVRLFPRVTAHSEKISLPQVVFIFIGIGAYILAPVFIDLVPCELHSPLGKLTYIVKRHGSGTVRIIMLYTFRRSGSTARSACGDSSA